MPIDVPYLTHSTAGINLAPLGRPPTYNKTAPAPAPASMESIHNHYYSQPHGTPWYRKKWFCYSMAFVIAFVVVAVAVVLGVLLKIESNKRNSGHLEEAPSSLSVSVLTLTTTPNSTSHSQASTSSTRKSSSAGPTPTQPPLILSKDTRLASTYSRSGRLLALQDSQGELVVIEWTNTSRRYLLRDKLANLPPARDGTPLAMMQDDSSGAVHLFYATPSHVLTHAYLEKDKWQLGDMATDRGLIRTSSTAMLSAAWHTNPGLLAVAFDDPTQQLQIALSDGGATWYVADVTPLDVQTAGAPCYSLAGDFSQAGRTALLLALVVGEEIVPWQCVVDSWPPPGVKVKCFPASDTFQGTGTAARAYLSNCLPLTTIIDADGTRLIMNPPPERLAWIRGEELTMLSLRSDGIAETILGRGRRRTGPGVKHEGLRALATDSDGLVFATDGAGVIALRKIGQSWAVDHSVKAGSG